ncbi:agmatine deiminase family protein [Xanthomonadaceae bacterium JHOS43]|nr:agmatine deiminase family protein [Xanthomonadaceae bacterium JHOS43]
MSQWRFPAEWEPQAAILLAWPHAGTDWAARLDEVERTYAALIGAITRFQSALLCVASPQIEQQARDALSHCGVDLGRVHFIAIDYDDTWLRDSGPITLMGANGDPRFLDFRFTGWGGKFEAGRDDALVTGLAERGVLDAESVERIDFALEGGAIETDGQGTLLSTWRCLAERHGDDAREAVTQTLSESLRQQRVLWLDHGHLEGDDTDAHIDTLARLAPDDAIVFQACDDPNDAHYDELAAMAEEIAALRTTDGRPYRLFPLPWPQPVLDEDRRLAASYANFLIINGAVLMPAYDDPADARAAAVLAQAFPDREIIQVPCRALIWQNGSLHCVTMQIPCGALSDA